MEDECTLQLRRRSTIDCDKTCPRSSQTITSTASFMALQSMSVIKPPTEIAQC